MENKYEIVREIAEADALIKSALPEDLRATLVLTGGSAAFLYGSDRPFSHDFDYMLPKASVEEIDSILGIEFAYNIKKKIFHSFKAVYEKEGMSFDLISESIVQPLGCDAEFTFFLSDNVIRRVIDIEYKEKTISVIPKEFLTLIKLLAGRGEDLGKYDIYDVYKVISMNKDFNFDYMKDLVMEFCRPLNIAIDILIANAYKTGERYGNKSVRPLLEVLKSIQ